MLESKNRKRTYIDTRIDLVVNVKPHACLFTKDKWFSRTKMYLMYYLDEKGERVYTFSKVDPAGKPTMSAHPAKFSPEDKYSRERILIKKRFGILPTQLPPLKY